MPLVSRCRISESEELSAYMDCMLDGGAMRKLSRHLKKCEDCRSILGELMEMRAAMRSVRNDVAQPHGEFWANAFRAARLADAGDHDFVPGPLVLSDTSVKRTRFSIRRVVTYATAAAIVLGALIAPFSIGGKTPAVQPADAAETVDVDAIVNSHAQTSLHAPLVSRPKAVMIESESTARQTGNTVDEAVFDIDQTSTDSPPAIR